MYDTVLLSQELILPPFVPPCNEALKCFFISHAVVDEALDLLMELHEWQTRPEFVYEHKWQPNMLVMWDNRSVLHRATGGYEGHDRLLHRTTIGERRDH